MVTSQKNMDATRKQPVSTYQVAIDVSVMMVGLVMVSNVKLSNVLTVFMVKQKSVSRFNRNGLLS